MADTRRPTLLADENRTIEDAKLVPDQMVMLEIQDIASGHWPCEKVCVDSVFY